MRGKKILIFIISILLLVLFTAISSTQASAQTCPIIRGDSNGNGAIEQIDSLLVAQVSSGLIPQPPAQTDEFCRMDATDDGRISISDSLYISQVFQGVRAPLGFCPTTYNCSLYDNDAPNLFIKHPFDTGRYNRTLLLVNISAYDINLDKVLYSIDGGIFQIYTAEFFFNFTIDNHTLTAFANDTYGNNVTQMIRFEVLRGRQIIPPTQPDTPPSAQLNATPRRGTESLLVNFVCFTPFGNPNFRYDINYGDGFTNVFFGGRTMPFTHTYNSFDNYTASCKITDNDGDFSTALVQIEVLANSTPPVANITSPLTGSRFLARARVNFTGTGFDLEDGALSGTSLVWDSNIDGILGSGITLNISTLSLGFHNISLTATDSSGYSGRDSIIVQIYGTQNRTPNNDTTSPFLRIIHPKDGAIYLVQNQLVNISAIDPNLDKVLYRINSGAWRQYNQEFYYIFNYGRNTIDAFANDTFGNNASHSIAFFVNATTLPRPGTNDTIPVVTIDAFPTSGIQPLATMINCTIVGGEPRYNILIDYDDGTIPAFFPGYSSMYVSVLHTYFNYGTYSPSCTVTDIDGDVGFANMLINVITNNSVPYFVNAVNLTGQEDSPFYYNLDALDNDVSDILSYFDNASFFAINQTTGEINFTPIQNDVRNNSITFTVCDDSGAPNACNSTIVNFEITSFNDAPLWNDTALALFNVTVPEDGYNDTIDLDDYVGDPNSITFAYNCSTNNLNLAAQVLPDGRLNLTATNNYYGNVNVTCDVRDSLGAMDTGSFIATVFPINDRPYFVNLINLIGQEDSLFYYDVDGDDNDTTDTLSYYENSTLFVINISTGEINFTPLQADIGNKSIIFRVCDNSGALNNCTSQTINFNITSFNDAPLWNDSLFALINATVPEDGYNDTIDLDDYVNDSNSIAFTYNCSTNNPNLAAQVLPDGRLNLTATNNYFGNVLVTCDVVDSLGARDTGRFWAFVFPVNDRPYFVNLMNLIGQEDSLFYYDVDGDDNDTTDTLSYYENSTLFAINISTGEINFTPLQADIGNKSIIFRVCDNSGALNNCTSQTINFNITSFNDAPVFNLPLPNATVLEDSFNLTFNITQFVNDTDSTNFTYNCSSNETDVVARVLPNGIVNITSSGNFTGRASLSCTVSDSSGGTGVGYFFADILPVNDPLYFIGPIQNITLFVNGSYRGLNLPSYFIDVDNEPIIYNFIPNPLFNFTISIGANGLVNITPNLGFFGNTTIRFNATDSLGSVLSNIVNISVLNVSALSEIVDSSVNGTAFSLAGPNLNGNYSSYPNTFDSDNILDSRIFRSTLVSDDYSINRTNVFDSRVITSYLISSNIRRNSTINNSILRNCVVENSLVKNYFGANCVINNSIVDPPSGLNNLTGTNVLGSTIMRSNVTHSKINSSTINDSDIDHATIIRCSVTNYDIYLGHYENCVLPGEEGSDIINSTIINSTVQAGNITNSTIINSILNGTNTTNTAIINSTLPPVNITDGNITDGKVCNGTLNQSGVANYTHAGPCINLTDIINYNPFAGFNFAGTVDNAPTLFTSTSADANIGGLLNDSLTYFWNFGNGQNSTATNPSITFSAGTYTITLTVTDRYGKRDTLSRQIVITSSGSGGGGGGGAGGGSGGSGGSGGGGGGGAILRPTDRVLDFGGINGGIRLWVVEGDRFVYRVNGIDHIITFAQITPIGASITATDSVPGRRVIPKTASAYFELNNDKNYDLGINIMQSANRRARVEFIQGGGPLSAEDLALLETLRARGIPLSGGRINEIPPSIGLSPKGGPAGSIQLLPGEEIKPWTNWWLWMILILVAVVAVFFASFDWIIGNIVKPLLRFILIDLFGWRKKEAKA